LADGLPIEQEFVQERPGHEGIQVGVRGPDDLGTAKASASSARTVLDGSASLRRVTNKTISARFHSRATAAETVRTSLPER
jgi:hypothetical protein